MNRAQYDIILKNAIQSEIAAQKFYGDVAGKMKDAFLKNLFTGFVSEEKKHQEILEGFRAAIPEKLPFEESRDYHVAEATPDPIVSPEMTPTDAFALAMKKEEEAMNHYTHLAGGCTDAKQKEIFLELAAMERDHKRKMERAFVDIGYPELW
ncbi:ferritin family protein [Desulfococcus sp.]|uniref:ferritin-like domain-containing protein n=1 Tax=Desulfococcus sp. TaxID=2025834 RepID=UPI003593A847